MDIIYLFIYIAPGDRSALCMDIINYYYFYSSIYFLYPKICYKNIKVKDEWQISVTKRANGGGHTHHRFVSP